MNSHISVSLLVIFFICFFTANYLELNQKKEKTCYIIEDSLLISNETHFTTISSALENGCDSITLTHEVSLYYTILDEPNEPETYSYDQEYFKSGTRHLIGVFLDNNEIKD